jgi:hypothetical protein
MWRDWVIGGGFVVLAIAALWTAFGDDLAQLLGAVH